jgi:non-heme Fe2+,alpha-ketoglutarate-dependent halogenase
MSSVASSLLSEIKTKGFVGPFTACTPEEMKEIRAKIEQDAIDTPSKIYGFPIGRDRHLDCRVIHDLFMRPGISSRLTEIMGPDLHIWRSGFFYKPSGAPETAWHKATVFTEFTDAPILEPPDDDGLHCLTIWIAIDEATIENGCVQLIPGTQEIKMRTAHEEFVKQSNEDKREFGTMKQGFFGYDVQWDLTEEHMKSIVSMECKPGQFFIFDQRTIHGSPPNNSPNRRLAINFRAITPDVKAYGHFLPEGKIEHYGHVFDLSKWGCIQYTGGDPYGYNKIVSPPED